MVYDVKSFFYKSINIHQAKFSLTREILCLDKLVSHRMLFTKTKLVNIEIYIGNRLLNVKEKKSDDKSEEA